MTQKKIVTFATLFSVVFITAHPRAVSLLDSHATQQGDAAGLHYYVIINLFPAGVPGGNLIQGATQGECQLFVTGFKRSIAQVPQQQRGLRLTRTAVINDMFRYPALGWRPWLNAENSR
jgi:hypothetical protein